MKCKEHDGVIISASQIKPGLFGKEAFARTEALVCRKCGKTLGCFQID